MEHWKYDHALPYVPRDLITIHSLTRQNNTASLINLLETDPQLVNDRSDQGFTPLHIAAIHGSYESACVLLKFNASVSIQDWESNWTPLHAAFYFGHTRIALTLLKAGALLGDEEADNEKNGYRAMGIVRHASVRQQHDLSLGRKRNGSVGSSSSSMCAPLDNEGFTPLALLSECLGKPFANPLAMSGDGKRRIVAGDKPRTKGMGYVFGKADFQLGIVLPNRNTHVFRARPLDSLNNVSLVNVFASKFASAAISNDGELYTWGYGKHGRLGHGHDGTVLIPQRVEFLELSTSRALNSGASEFVTDEPESLKVYGVPRLSSLQQPRPYIVNVAMAENHCLAISRDGSLWAWGSPKYGKLGLGTQLMAAAQVMTNTTGSAPSALIFVSVPTRVVSLRKHRIVGISAGDTHSLCYSDKGLIWGFGSNKQGQLGTAVLEGTGNEVDSPRLIALRPNDAVYGSGITASPINSKHNTAPNNVKESPNLRNQNSFRPETTSVRRVLQISAGAQSSLILLLPDGYPKPLLNCAAGMPKMESLSNQFEQAWTEVWQLGFGIPVPKRVKFSVPAMADNPATPSPTSGSNVTKNVGQLGATKSVNKTSRISNIQECTTHRQVNIAQVSAGRFHHVALTTAGHVYTWGARVDIVGHEAGSWYGAGSLERQQRTRQLSIPQLVTGLLLENGGGQIVNISATSNRTYAVSSVGDLYTWNASEYTLQGPDNLVVNASAVEVLRVTAVKKIEAIAAAEDHTIALARFTSPPLPGQQWILRHADGSKSSNNINADTIDGSDSDESDSRADGDAWDDNDSTSSASHSSVHESIEYADSSDCDSSNGKNASMMPGSTDFLKKPLSLKLFCERTLANQVSIYNVIAMCAVADQLDAPALRAYCSEFLQLNLDAVLVYHRWNHPEALAYLINDELGAAVPAAASKTTNTVLSISSSKTPTETSTKHIYSELNERRCSRGDSIDWTLTEPSRVMSLPMLRSSPLPVASLQGKDSVEKQVQHAEIPLESGTLDTSNSETSGIRAAHSEKMVEKNSGSASPSVSSFPIKKREKGVVLLSTAVPVVQGSVRGSGSAANGVQANAAAGHIAGRTVPLTFSSVVASSGIVSTVDSSTIPSSSPLERLVGVCAVSTPSNVPTPSRSGAVAVTPTKTSGSPQDSSATEMTRDGTQSYSSHTLFDFLVKRKHTGAKMVTPIIPKPSMGWGHIRPTSQDVTFDSAYAKTLVEGSDLKPDNGVGGVTKLVDIQQLERQERENTSAKFASNANNSFWYVQNRLRAASLGQIMCEEATSLANMQAEKDAKLLLAKESKENIKLVKQFIREQEQSDKRKMRVPKTKTNDTAHIANVTKTSAVQPKLNEVTLSLKSLSEVNVIATSSPAKATRGPKRGKSFDMPITDACRISTSAQEIANNTNINMQRTSLATLSATAAEFKPRGWSAATSAL